MPTPLENTHAALQVVEDYPPPADYDQMLHLVGLTFKAYSKIVALYADGYTDADIGRAAEILKEGLRTAEAAFAPLNTSWAERRSIRTLAEYAPIVSDIAGTAKSLIPALP